MKSSGVLKFTIILLFIIFSLKALSEIAFIKATSGENVRLSLIKMSTQIFPVISDHNYRYGNILLEMYAENKNEKVLDESRGMFRRSLALNNLNFSSHFLLGRSYLASDSADPTEFDKGLKFIKNASLIRKTNLGINVDTIKIYLSLWPFISKEDREVAVSLMRISMPKIEKNKFGEIMEAWGFYSKDSSFLSAILNEYGKHYFIVLNELLKHELHIDIRHKLLAQWEYLIFKECESEKIKYSNNIKQSSKLYRRVSTWIKGYYKFSSETKFRHTLWNKLKKELLLRLIKLNLKDLNSKNEKNTLSLSKSYLASFNLIHDIEILYEILTQKKFFNSNDMKVFYLKQLINFRTGQVSKMINETEGFRQSVTFIKNGQKEVLSKLLILLVDGYINSRLLTKAMDILKEIEKISPGLMSTYWRLMRIESVIGEDEFFADIREESFNKIMNSNSILINNQKVNTAVYPYKVDKLVLNLDENFTEKFGEFHLLQVFLNGRIFHESYIEGLEFPIELPFPGKLKKANFYVETKLVK